jgi:protein gp37
MKTTIEWTQVTWNPVTGCTKISAGCKNCYAARLAHRLQAMGQPKYHNGFEVTVHPEVLDLPKQWREGRLIFVNSMSDLFHERVPLDFIQRVFEVMESCPQHTFQVLTKRSTNLRILRRLLPWPRNVWRIDDLREVPAAVRFLSLEPLIGPLEDLNLDGIHWVIVGGESGPGARPMEADWVRSIRDQCRRARVPFFFKQWGGTNKKAAGRTLDGQIYDEMPEVIRASPSSRPSPSRERECFAASTVGAMA